MKNTLIKALETTGLKPQQIKIYLELLKRGEASAGQLSYTTKIKRSSVYLLLKQLLEKGVVSQRDKGGVMYFRPLHPSLITQIEKEKIIHLEQVLPELKNLKGIIKHTPKIRVYEGVKEVIELCEDTLSCSTELLSWVDITNVTRDPDIKAYSKEYWKKRVERNIKSRGIWSYDKIALEYKKAAPTENRELVLISKKTFPFKNEIWVYDNKIAILSTEDMSGVIVENQIISDTHRSLFELSFQIGKEQEKELLSKEDLAYLAE